MGRFLLYYHGFVLKPHPSRYPSERTSRQLETLSALEETIRKIGYGRVRLKSRSSLIDYRIFIDHGWQAEPSYTYVVPLTDPELLWSRMEQNLRRLVSRSEREGVEFSDDDDFGSFYRLHVQTHARKGAAIYLPEPGFHRYFERLRAQNLCRLFHARNREGRVMASQLVLLGTHPVCHTVSASTDVEFLKTGVTAFLRWKAFERLRQLGYAANDLTDAQLNPVTHFKSQLGGELQMNVVLERPDRVGFSFQKLVYGAGSLAKRSVAALVAPARRTGLRA
jgi:lipid II:glycine glycyltransferase (peptidoglycan interpeptide bridge formation enzyme)